MSFSRILLVTSFALAIALPAAAVPIVGPSFPPVGGSVDYAFSGAPSPADAGGSTVEFSNFSLPGTTSALYWGPDSGALPTAALDGSSDALTLSGISGTQATWTGTTSWTDPDTSTFYASVPISLVISISGLGANPWVLATSVTGLDPGVGAGIGAVVDTALGTDFDATVEFFATTVPDGTIALNDVHQTGGGTLSTFSGGFYSAVPEPGTAMLLGLGLVGLARRGSKRR